MNQSPHQRFSALVSAQLNPEKRQKDFCKYLHHQNQAGSNPLESVNRYYLYYMKAESPIQFSVNYLLHELQALTLGSGETKAEEENLKNAIQWCDP